MSKEKDLSPKLFPSPSRGPELWGFCFVRTRRSWRDFCSSECEEVRRVLPSCSVRVLPLRPFGDGRREWQVCNFFKLLRHKKTRKKERGKKGSSFITCPRNRRCIKSTKKVNEIKKTERKEEKRRKRREKKKRKNYHNS